MDTPTVEDIAAALDARREELGISTKALALRTGIPLSTLQRLLNGDPNLKLNQLRSLSDALGKPVASWLRAS